MKLLRFVIEENTKILKDVQKMSLMKEAEQSEKGQSS